MGAGIAAIYLRDYSNADIALCEASRLDPKNPDVWTWLAFLAAKLHRRQEAATCMAWASNHRTENAELLQRLSMEFEELGW
jgi:Tfp pilus assembly protein PilF